MKALHAVLAVLILSAATATQARADPAAPVRAEVPVREVVLSDGTRRYAVPIKVGATVIEAGLDTGSTGLRVLPGVLGRDDAGATRREDTYSYGAGAQLDGVVAEADIGVGGLAGHTSLQLVERVGCNDQVPHCAAASIPLAQYGIQGDGLPGEGFKAILGVNMADADVASLFKGIGARRWIIDLPRPGESRQGRIVLNPSDAEVEGFVNLPVMSRFADRQGGAHDAVEGCLVNDRGHDRLCGAVMLDTGAPGLRVVRPDAGTAQWPDESPATLLFADDSGHVRAVERFVIGRRAQASHLAFERRANAPMTMIYAGLTPYLAYSVLYDPQKGTIGLKPRLPTSDSPTAAQAN